MSYQPQFTITPALLSEVEHISALRERIQAATIQVPWIPALQKDTRTRNTHSSTALRWWNEKSIKLSPVLSSAILHYRFEAIHPFADGNGRAGRALALWELYRRGFDTHHIFSVDEFYWEDRDRYYQSLDAVRRAGEDLTGWLEYAAEGLRKTLERVWTRVQNFSARSTKKKFVLRPKQEQLLQLLRDKQSMSPREIWDAMAISKQGALDLLQPLIQAGLVRRVGSKKNGRYIMA